MKVTFLVVYEKGRKQYSGFAPDVAGCGSAGDTLEDVRVNLREALELYMQTAREFDYPIPEPKIQSVTLPIEGELDPKTTYIVEHLTIEVRDPKVRKTRPVRPANTKRRALTAA